MLTRWDPFSEMASMREAVNRLFGEHFLRPGASWAMSPAAGTTPFDLYETPDDVVVRVALPGADPQQTELAVNQGVLTIKGYRGLYHGDQEKQYTWHVRGLPEGEFQISVALPTAVNADAAHATYDAGILTVSLPKTEAVKPRRIAIQSGRTDGALVSAGR